jgi:RNA polymerase sigma factor (sigma-70 family)
MTRLETTTLEDRPLTVDFVYREHAETVARWVARLGGPILDVEDVMHDVFVKVEQELPAFRGDARLTTWLYAVTLNVVRSRRRKERFRRFFRAPADEGRRIADSGALADEVLSRQQNSRRLYCVLDRLNERYRQVLVLFELEERPGREVAELMNASQENVWVWLHRARAAFARELARVEEEEPTDG